MSECGLCKHEEVKILPPGKSYRCCKKLSTVKDVVLCLNAREQEQQCGPQGKLFENK